MGRYTGPVCRLCRREGMKLYLKGERCLGPKCPIVKRQPNRNYPPGQHGQKRTRRPSEYALQLREKQRLKRLYGILERQFRRHFEEAERRPGLTGENLLQILERRLDNVVYRLGFADSRRQARQLVTHGHFLVNGRKTDIPSYLVRPGDIIAVRPQSREREYFKVVQETAQSKPVPAWLTRDLETMSGRVVSLPAADQIDIPAINTQLVVEYYSRR
ncbi:30S ribosomal protein S4 [Thermomicrobiaceae bacterium CFH 74404]|uniref:Small ribosomal subunit protein uS4 n=2 Tax=Thermomicrobia TaxID=189775 RepID=A0AA41WI56_9BACT|nr:30S ribosomal protein S4 [Thermalbibacter longus]MCM8750553.1 30S ribosomal protein S4 [Thermalbibacter longus]